MNILYVANSHIWGGGEQVVLTAARAMLRRGHAAAIACSPASPLAERCGTAKPSIPVVPLEIGPKLGRRSALEFLLRWRGYRGTVVEAVTCADGHWDVVHFQYKKEQLVATRALRRLGYTVVWTEHGGLPRAMVGNPVARRWYRAAAKQANGIAAVSEYVRASLLAAGIEKRLVSIVHNPVDIASFAADQARKLEWRGAVRAEMGWSKEAIVVGTATRIERHKGVDHLLHALAPIIAADDRVRGLIVGDGLQRLALEETVPPALRGKIVFTGFRSDIPRLLASMDVFVSATTDPTEGFPLRILEAMAAGLPSVATRMAGQADAVVDGVTGLLVNVPVLVPDLKRKIRQLTKDGAGRDALGREAARVAIERFSADRFVEAHIGFLENAMASS